MIRIALLVFALFLWFAVPAQVVAQDATTEKTKLLEFISEKWPFMLKGRTVKPTVQTPGDTAPKSLDPSVRVWQTSKSMLGSYKQRHGQYGDFLGKLKTRRDKMAAEGKDVKEVSDLIVKVQQAHEKSRLALDGEHAAVGKLAGPGDVQGMMAAIRKDSALLSQLFDQEHATMMRAVKVMQDVTARQAKQPSSGGVFPSRAAKWINTSPDVPPPMYNDGADK